MPHSRPLDCVLRYSFVHCGLTMSLVMSVRTMAAPSSTAKDLYNAILSNKEALVKSCLESGTVPGVNLGAVIPTLHGVLFPPNCKILLRNRSEADAPSPLHVAVVNCYHSVQTPESCLQAVRIVSQLAKAGADPTIETNNFTLGYTPAHVHDNCYPLNSVTPLGLAYFLKKLLGSTSKDDRRRRKVLEAASMILKRHERSWSLQGRINFEKAFYGYTKPTKGPVPESVVTSWKNLLFSEEFSDITFQCPDGTAFHAHKNVLAATSSYFRAAFSGPWREQDTTGHWKTSNSPEIMKAVLTFVYTGAVASELDVDPSGMLAVASEYDLQALREVCEASCKRKLNDGNVKELLQIAHLFGSSALKKSCFDFVRMNWTSVLTNPSMASLATDDAELWAEMAAAIGGGGNSTSKKRVHIQEVTSRKRRGHSIDSSSSD